MSVDGEVLADLRRLLRSCRDGAAAVEPLPTRLLLITGPRGMGKTTALTSILQSLQHIDATTTAEEYVMVADLASVCEPTSDNVVVSSPNKMSSSAVALLPISYMSVQEELHRPRSPLAGTADLRFSVPVIGVVDDVDLVWRLCAMNRVLPALRRLLHPLLRRPPSSTSVAGKVERDGLLLITAMDAGSVPRELLDASPPLCYALPAGLTAPAARRLTRGLPSTSQTLRDWADAAATAMEGDVRAQGAERSPPSRRLLMMGLCLADDAKKNANTEPNEMKSSRDDERRLASCLSWLSSAAVGMAPSTNKLHRPASTLYGLDDLAERLRLMVSIFIAQHQHNTTSKSGGRPSGTLSATVPCTTGVLLYGPSGCGKTALLRWLSSEAFPHISFFMVSCTSLFGKYLGESEERLRAIYRDARSRAPSVVVLDEMDVVAASRGEMQGSSGSTSGGVDVVKRMLAALLCELDGVADNRGVLTIGTTNTPRSMDQAVLRQGRLETLLPVPPLTREAAELMAWRCFSQFARHPSHDDDDDGTTACEEEARRLSSLIASRAVGCAPVSLAYTLRKVVERSLGDEDEPSHTTADTSSANNHKANCVIPALPSQRVVDSVLFECTSVLIPTHVEILS